MRRNVNERLLELLEKGGAFTSGDATRLLGISRQAAHRYLKAMVEEGVLVREGAGRGAHYRRARKRSAQYRLAGLAEDRAWSALSRTAAELTRLPDNVLGIVRYAFTEMLNNSIDHSEGRGAKVWLQRRRGRITFEIEDDGIGVFEKIRRARGLASATEAVGELSKGKLTTDPERHTGEGIFFVSKAVDLFELDANGVLWLVDNVRDDTAIGLGRQKRGTRVHLEIAADSKRRLDQLFGAYTEDFEFVRSRTYVKLFEHGTTFISRSEAKRLSGGLERFREVILDFKDVTTVGQGFADELFRVWARAHPTTRLVAVNAEGPAAFMLERALRGAE